MALASIAILALSLWSFTHQDIVQRSVERLLPPVVAATEAHQSRVDGATFDHSRFDALLRAHVDGDGWVDYEGIRDDASLLESYLRQLADAPFDALSRNGKLALLINAYNAFTIRLILDYYPWHRSAIFRATGAGPRCAGSWGPTPGV